MMPVAHCSTGWPGLASTRWRGSHLGRGCRDVLLPSRRPTNRLRRSEFGSGCHPSRAIALSRALTEAVQARTTYIAGSRDDFLPALYSAAARERRLRDCRAFWPCARSRSFQDVPNFEADDIADDVDWMLRRLAKAGMAQALVVDLTIAKYGLPVACA